MSGIIVLEDGTIEVFGQLRTARFIAEALQKVIPELLQQERSQLLETVTQDELKGIIERLQK